MRSQSASSGIFSAKPERAELRKQAERLPRREKPQDGKRLTEALSGLRTVEQIRTAYSRALEILPHIDQERLRTVLEQFVKDCKALPDDICPKKEEVRQGESAD